MRHSKLRMQQKWSGTLFRGFRCSNKQGVELLCHRIAKDPRIKIQNNGKIPALLRDRINNARARSNFRDSVTRTGMRNRTQDEAGEASNRTKRPARTGNVRENTSNIKEAVRKFRLRTASFFYENVRWSKPDATSHSYSALFLYNTGGGHPGPPLQRYHGYGL